MHNIWVDCEVVLGGVCACVTQCALWEIKVLTVQKGVPTVGQEQGVQITWHALLGADPRPVLRLPVSPHPNQSGPESALTYTRPRPMLR